MTLPTFTLFPYTTLFRSRLADGGKVHFNAGWVDYIEMNRSESTRLNSSHVKTSYAVFCSKKKSDYFMQRYHDVISSFGGKTSYDADNRPLLVMRSNLWAS